MIQKLFLLLDFRVFRLLRNIRAMVRVVAYYHSINFLYYVTYIKAVAWDSNQENTLSNTHTHTYAKKNDYY